MRSILFIFSVFLSMGLMGQNNIDQRKLTFLLKTEVTNLCLDCAIEDCETFMINSHVFTQLETLSIINWDKGITLNGIQFLPNLKSLELVNVEMSKRSKVKAIESLTQLKHLAIYEDNSIAHYKSSALMASPDKFTIHIDLSSFPNLTFLRLEQYLDTDKLIEELNTLSQLDTLILNKCKIDILDCANLTLDSLTYLEVYDFLLHPKIVVPRSIYKRGSYKNAYLWRERPYYKKYNSELRNSQVPMRFNSASLFLYKNLAYPTQLKVADLHLKKAPYFVASYERHRDIMGSSIFYQTDFIPSQNFEYSFYHNAIMFKAIHQWMNNLYGGSPKDTAVLKDSIPLKEKTYFGSLKVGRQSIRAFSLAYLNPKLYKKHDHFEKWDTTLIEERQKSLKYANGSITKIHWKTEEAPSYFKNKKMEVMEQYYHQFYKIEKLKVEHGNKIYKIEPVRRWDVKEDLNEIERRSENLRDINPVRSIGFIPLNQDEDGMKDFLGANIMDFWLDCDSGTDEAVLNIKLISGIKSIEIEWKTLNGDTVRRNLDRTYASYNRAEKRNNKYINVYGKRTLQKMINRDKSRLRGSKKTRRLNSEFCQSHKMRLAGASNREVKLVL